MQKTSVSDINREVTHLRGKVIAQLCLFCGQRRKCPRIRGGGISVIRKSQPAALLTAKIGSSHSMRFFHFGLETSLDSNIGFKYPNKTTTTPSGLLRTRTLSIPPEPTSRLHRHFIHNDRAASDFDCETGEILKFQPSHTTHDQSLPPTLTVESPRPLPKIFVCYATLAVGTSSAVPAFPSPSVPVVPGPWVPTSLPSPPLGSKPSFSAQKDASKSAKKQLFCRIFSHFFLLFQHLFAPL